jgi:hypothetical protein
VGNVPSKCQLPAHMPDGSADRAVLADRARVARGPLAVPRSGREDVLDERDEDILDRVAAMTAIRSRTAPPAGSVRPPVRAYGRTTGPASPSIHLSYGRTAGSLGSHLAGGQPGLRGEVRAGALDQHRPSHKR